MNSLDRLTKLKALAVENKTDWRAIRADYRGDKFKFPRKEYIYNPRIENTSKFDSSHKRFIENTEKAGLREVGAAHEIVTRNTSHCPIDHTGWFIDNYECETIAGYVWQLPARKGQPVYVVGYKDNNNEGAALIDFEAIYGAYGGDEYKESDELRDAARAADSMAQYAAEKEREYQRQYEREQRIESIAEEIASERASIRALIADIRKAQLDDVPAICATLKGAIRNGLHAITELRSERDTLVNY